MPFDSNGRFSLAPGYMAVTGQTILASQHNPPLEDIASGLSSTMLRTGVAPMVADLPMGGFQITGLAAGVDSTDAVNVGQAASVSAAAIAAAPTKAGPVDADSLTLIDSAASNSLKRVTWAVLKTLLQPYNAVLTALSSLGTAAGGDVIYGSGVGTWARLPKGTAGSTLRMNAAAMAPEWGGSNGVADAILEDQKSAGSSGGGATSGAWRTRDLNTKTRDTSSLVALASNQFTPTVAGWVEWSAPAYACGTNKTRLYNVTDSTVAGFGSSASASAANFVSSLSIGGCAVAAGKAYRLEHQVSTTNGADGFGDVGAGFSQIEIYSRVKFWRT